MFELSNYKKSIEAIASKHGVPMEKAVNMFVLNLNAMKEQFDGAGADVNYHVLGQQWARLSSDERRRQKEAVLKTRSRNNSMMGGN